MANIKTREWYGLPAASGEDALGVVVARVAAAVPQATTETLFTVPGGG